MPPSEKRQRTSEFQDPAPVTSPRAPSRLRYDLNGWPEAIWMENLELSFSLIYVGEARLPPALARLARTPQPDMPRASERPAAPSEASRLIL